MGAGEAAQAAPVGGRSSTKVQCVFMRRRSAFRNWIEYSAGARWCSNPWSGRRCRWRMGWRGVVRGARSRPAALATGGFAQPVAGHAGVSTKARGAALPTACSARWPACWFRSPGFPRSIAAISTDGSAGRAPSTSRTPCARGRGVLFATAHLGNWELSAFAHALLAGPMHIVVRPLDNPLIDRLVERRRTSHRQPPDREEGFRAQHPEGAGRQPGGGNPDRSECHARRWRLRGFLRPAACAGTGFAKLAAHSGAAVIPGFALWSDEERRYVLRFYPPVPITGDAARDTQTPAIRPGSGDPRVPGPMAVDSPALEDAARGRGDGV